MSTGLLSIRHRKPATAAADQAREKAVPRTGSYLYFVRGHDHHAEQTDAKVEVQKKERLRPYDKLLRKFKYSQALDAALEGRPKAVVVVSVLHELVRRSGLRAALSGRDEVTLRPVLLFLTKNVANPRYARLLIGVSNVILGGFANSCLRPHAAQRVRIGYRSRHVVPHYTA